MMSTTPDAVSYAALLLVINNRLNLPRSINEQRYFIELAHDLIRLYWRYDADEQDRQSRQRAA